MADEKVPQTLEGGVQASCSGRLSIHTKFILMGEAQAAIKSHIVFFVQPFSCFISFLCVRVCFGLQTFFFVTALISQAPLL